MIKNMAVALNGGTPEKRNAITNSFQGKGFAFWHWIDDFWIVQPDVSLTPKALALELRALPEIGGFTHMLVFDLPDHLTYWGWANQEAWDWLTKAGSKASS